MYPSNNSFGLKWSDGAGGVVAALLAGVQRRAVRMGAGLTLIYRSRSCCCGTGCTAPVPSQRPRLGVVTVVHAIPGRRAPPAPLGAPGYWSLACTAAPRAEKPWRISRYPVRVAHHAGRLELRTSPRTRPSEAAAVWLAATDRSGPENSRSRRGQMVPPANVMA